MKKIAALIIKIVTGIIFLGGCFAILLGTLYLLGRFMTFVLVQIFQAKWLVDLFFVPRYPYECNFNYVVVGTLAFGYLLIVAGLLLAGWMIGHILLSSQGGEKMKKLSIVLTSIFILSLAGCMGLAARTKVLYPNPTNDAQELANYVVAQNRDYDFDDCRSDKGCYNLLTNDFKKTGDVAIISGLSVTVTVGDDGRRLFISKYLILLFGENGMERIDIAFVDKNIDGVVDYYGYKKMKDYKISEEIEYTNKKVSKNDGERVDATAEEIALFQKYYDDNLNGSIFELMEEYSRY